MQNDIQRHARRTAENARPQPFPGRDPSVPPRGLDSAQEIPARPLSMRNLGALEHVRAVEFITRVNGGSQPQLTLCDDNAYYIVKFKNNPQCGGRTLANDLLGTRLAQLLRLPTPQVAIVGASVELIARSASAKIEVGAKVNANIPWYEPRHFVPCEAGRCFGSRHSAYRRSYPHYAYIRDKIDRRELARLANKDDLFGMLVFDWWTGNRDARQVVYNRRRSGCAYRAVMIDQGHCFGAGAWGFGDLSAPRMIAMAVRCLLGVHWEPRMTDFEPWLSRLEDLALDHLQGLADEVPREWYGDRAALGSLVLELNRRRGQARGAFREAIPVVRRMTRFPFPLPAVPVVAT